MLYVIQADNRFEGIGHELFIQTDNRFGGTVEEALHNPIIVLEKVGCVCVQVIYSIIHGFMMCEFQVARFKNLMTFSKQTIERRASSLDAIEN